MPSGAPEGLCPGCLLQRGVAADSASHPHAQPFEPPSILELARLFPQYEILALIGKGGMGAVYKCRQPALDRMVALKILPPKTSTGTRFSERFNREARALARLSHPNIVAVHEFGQVEGLPYFVMEFVDGANLRQLERERRLAPREALAIIAQICDALQFAHDEGVVHRDIKPENVLIDRKGRVKIADFGLAKILDTAPADPSLTVEGQVMGTPQYMAPEQLEHPTDVDHRADIFSLGVVLYELLTGELPLGKFAPPSRKVEIDVRLDEIVLRALEKEPSQRYQRAGEMKSQVNTVNEPAGSQTLAANAVAWKPLLPNLAQHGAVAILVLAFFALCMPLLVRHISQSGNQHLPALTVFALGFTAFVRAFWYLLLPAYLGLDLAIMVALRRGGQKWLLLWSLGTHIGLVLLMAIAAIGAVLPGAGHAAVDEAAVPKYQALNAPFRVPVAGGSLELVALCDSEASDSDKVQFWLPNGERISDADVSFPSGSDIAQAEPSFRRFLAVRVEGMTNATRPVVVCDGVDLWAVGNAHRNGAYSTNDYFLTLGFRNTAKIVNLRIGIAAQTNSRYMADMCRIGYEPPANYSGWGTYNLHGLTWEVEIQDVEEIRGFLKILAYHTVREGWDTTLILLDKNEKEIPFVRGSRTAGNYCHINGECRISIDEIGAFYLRVRPIHWLELRNISLQPGTGTQVQYADLGTKSAKDSFQDDLYKSPKPNIRQTNTVDKASQLKLEYLENELKIVERKREVGVATPLDYERAKAARDIAAAQLKGDNLEAARVKLALAEIELKTVINMQSVGRATSDEVLRARLERDLAAAQLETERTNTATQQ